MGDRRSSPARRSQAVRGPGAQGRRVHVHLPGPPDDDDGHPDGQVARRAHGRSRACERPDGWRTMAQQALHIGNDARRAAGPSSGCSTRRLGLGVAQGRLLVRRHHLHARLHPGPGLLLHGQPDDRPRHPRLEPGQLLPAGERVPAVPAAGRRRRAVAGRAAGDRRCRRRGPTAPSSSPGRRSCTSAGQRRVEGRPTRRSSRRSPATGNFDKWTDGPEAARAPAPTPPSVFSGGKIYVVGGIGADGKPTDDGRTS